MNRIQELLTPSKRGRLAGFSPLPNTGFALINYFHEEALGCLEAGLDQAAIMATNVLFEATCKLLVTAHHIGKGVSPLRAVQTWNNVSLGPLIRELGKEHILPPDCVDQFHAKRKALRNFFQHGNTPLITFESADRDEFDERGVVTALFVGHALGLMVNVQQESFDWFLFVDRQVRNRVPWKKVAASLRGTVEWPVKDGFITFGHGATGVFGRPRDIWERPTELLGRPVEAKIEPGPRPTRG